MLTRIYYTTYCLVHYLLIIILFIIYHILIFTFKAPETRLPQLLGSSICKGNLPHIQVNRESVELNGRLFISFKLVYYF
jgi:hypothetical protein